MADDPLQQQSAQVIWRRQVANRLGATSRVLTVSATTGFMLFPTMSGVPTGTPTSGEGSVVIDTQNSRLYFYSSGAWRNAGP